MSKPLSSGTKGPRNHQKGPLPRPTLPKRQLSSRDSARTAERFGKTGPLPRKRRSVRGTVMFRLRFYATARQGPFHRPPARHRRPFPKTGRPSASMTATGEIGIPCFARGTDERPAPGHQAPAGQGPDRQDPRSRAASAPMPRRDQCRGGAASSPATPPEGLLTCASQRPSSSTQLSPYGTSKHLLSPGGPLRGRTVQPKGVTNRSCRTPPPRGSGRASGQAYAGVSGPRTRWGRSDDRRPKAAARRSRPDRLFQRGAAFPIMRPGHASPISAARARTASGPTNGPTRGCCRVRPARSLPSGCGA